jgi:hypothetical protein
MNIKKIPQRRAAEFLLYNLGKVHIVDFFVKLWKRRKNMKKYLAILTILVATSAFFAQSNLYKCNNNTY